MNIVLSGYMASGKSLIGRKLAKKLGFSFIDLDDEIIEKEKLSIPEIFSKKGEISFRKLEMEVLKETLQNSKNTVLALGGGTPCYGNNIEVIKESFETRLIYLKISLDVLTERLFAERASRPLISEFGNKEILKDYVRKHLFERQYYYFQCDFNVDCSELSPEEVVERIEQELRMKD